MKFKLESDNKGAYLKITAETEIERVALGMWWDNAIYCDASLKDIIELELNEWEPQEASHE